MNGLSRMRASTMLGFVGTMALALTAHHTPIVEQLDSGVPTPSPDPTEPVYFAHYRGTMKFSGKDYNNPGEPRTRPLADRIARRAKRWQRRRARIARAA